VTSLLDRMLGLDAPAGGAVHKSPMARLVIRGMREGWRRGVVDGNATWTALGGLALLGYLAGRAWHKEAEVVFAEVLAPGQIIQIAHDAAPLT
jgi:hypothetical protein